MFFFVAMFLQSAWAWATPIVSSVIGASTAATIAQTLRVITLVAMLGSLQRKSVESTGQELTLTTDPNAGVPIAFGERMDAGTLVFRKTYTGGVNDAEANQILTMIKVISGGGVIDGFVNTTFTANVVDTAWNSGDAGGTSIVKPTWAVDPVAESGPERRLSPLTSVSPDTDKVFVYGGNYAQFRSRGDITQNLTDVAYYNPQVWADCGDQFKFTGFAYVVEVLKNNNTTFPQGVPNTTFLSRGLRWFDPRNEACVWEEPNTYVYSTNGPIIAYNLIRGRLEYQADGTVVESFGLGVPISLIDEDSFITAANLADTYGLTVHGRPLTTDSMIKILDMIMSCSGGFLTSNGAKISAFIYSPKTTVMDLTDADLVGDFTIPFSPSYRDRLNSVIPSYPEPLQNWGTWIGNAIQQQQYIDEDGELKQTTLNLDYTTNLDSASWLAGLELVNSREMLSPEIVCGLRTIALQTGDAITFQSDANNIEQFKFLVIQREIDLSTMTVKLKLQSENDEKYAFLEGLTSTPPSSASVAGIDWTTAIPPDADNWTVAPSLDANQVPDILITGNVASIPSSIVQARFSYKLSTDDTFTFSGSVPIAGNISDDVKYTISGLQPATSYDVQIGFVSSLGIISQGVTFGDVITTELVASDTLNVAGSNAATLVNSVVTAFTLANNAVIQTAVLADQMTANNMALANSIAQSTTDAASALAQQASDINNTITTTAATLTSQIDGVAANLLSNTTQIYSEINSLQSNVATMNGVIESISANATSALTIQLVGGYGGNSIGDVTSGLLYQANELRVTGDNTLSNSITAVQTALTQTNANVATKASVTDLTAAESNITATQNSVTSLASTTTLLQNELSTVRNGVANAATVTALSQTNANVATLGNTVTAQGSLISGLQTTVGGLASSAALSSLASNVTTLAGEVTSNAAALTALQGTVAGKADSSALSALQSTVTSLGSNVATQAGQIASLNTTVSGLATSAALSSLSSTVSSLSGALSTTSSSLTSLTAQTQYPNPNLIYNPTWALGYAGWTADTTKWVLESGPAAEGPYLYCNQGSGSGSTYIANSQRFFVYASTSYVLSGVLFAGGLSGGNFCMDIEWFDGTGTHISYSNRIYATGGTSWTNYSEVITSPSNASQGSVRVFLENATNNGSAAKRIKLEAGTVETTWSDDTTFGTYASGQASALSSLSASLSSLGATVSSQASSITTLQTQMGTRPNIVPNGGFANGMTGWTAYGVTFSASASGWGAAATWGGTSPPNPVVLVSPTFSVFGGAIYTASGDIMMFDASGCSSYLDMQFFDSSGNNVLDGPQSIINGPHDFDLTEQRRYQYAVQATAPSNAAYAYVRAVWFPTSAATYMGARRMKVEQGPLPATPFTDDATIGQTTASAFASASSLSSLTTTVTGQGATLSSQASSLSSLSTTVSGHTSTISSLQTTVNGISAKAGLTLDVNGYITGWALNNNGSSGSMNILADDLNITSYNTGRTEFSSANWRVYDSSGTLRVRMGIW